MRAPIWTTKVLFSRSGTAAANSFCLTSSTCQVVKKTLTVVYNLYLSFQSLKLTLTFLKVKKSIPRATSMLVSANKKVSPKKQDLLSLLSIKKEVITILKVSNLLSSIFWAPTSVLHTQRSSFLAKLGCIALILLLESMSALIKCWPNCIKYWMHGNRYSSSLGTTESVSVLATVTNAEVAETDTSFFTSCWGTY